MWDDGAAAARQLELQKTALGQLGQETAEEGLEGAICRIRKQWEQYFLFPSAAVGIKGKGE